MQKKNYELKNINVSEKELPYEQPVFHMWATL